MWLLFLFGNFEGSTERSVIIWGTCWAIVCVVAFWELLLSYQNCLVYMAILSHAKNIIISKRVQIIVIASIVSSLSRGTSIISSLSRDFELCWLWAEIKSWFGWVICIIIIHILNLRVDEFNGDVWLRYYFVFTFWPLAENPISVCLIFRLSWWDYSLNV